MFTRSFWSHVAFLFSSVGMFTFSSAYAAREPDPCREEPEACPDTGTEGADCLAEGTLIWTADGARRSIEEATKRMQVVTNDEGGTLEVLERVGGRLHSQDLLVIRDEQGNELALTGGHPVYTVAHGAIPAIALEPGDEIYNETGTSRLVSVTWSSEDVRVYNLVLNDRASKPREEVATAMYANGIRVGDARLELRLSLQSHESVAQSRSGTADTRRRATLNAARVACSSEWETEYFDAAGLTVGLRGCDCVAGYYRSGKTSDIYETSYFDACAR